MTGCAGIWNSKLLCEAGGDESKRVTAYVVVAKRLGNLWHVACCALAACAIGSMVRMLTYGPLKSRWIGACVATQAKSIARDDQV